MAKSKSPSDPSTRVQGKRRRSPEDDPECYRVTVNGPLKRALEAVHGDMQESRKYRRLASSSIHELAKEALDLGLQYMEAEIEQEAQDRS